MARSHKGAQGPGPWSMFAIMVVLFAAAILAVVFVTVERARGQVYDQITVNLGALSNSPVTAKPTAGVFLWLSCTNPNTTQAWVQMFDLASAITLGTTPPTRTYALAPSSNNGFVPAAAGGLSLFVTNSIRLAATATQTGAGAPSTPVACDVSYR